MFSIYQLGVVPLDTSFRPRLEPALAVPYNSPQTQECWESTLALRHDKGRADPAGTLTWVGPVPLAEEGSHE